MKSKEYSKPEMDVLEIETKDGYMDVIVASLPQVDDDDSADMFP